MRKRLFLFTTLITLTALICFFVAALYITADNNRKIAENTVTETAQICANLYSYDTDLTAFVNSGGDIRITVIASDGTVLADSQPLNTITLDAHLDRPEIQAALNDSPVVQIRYSSTLNMYLLYYALKVDIISSSSGNADYIFIRTALPIDGIDAYMLQLLPMFLLILAIISIICFVTSRSVINKVTKPLESVKHKLSMLSNNMYARVPLTSNYEEINAIVSEIDDVAQILQESMNQLQYEKNKAEHIFNNIADGIFAVNKEKDLVLINNSAMRIFNASGEIIGKGINYLTYDKTLLDAIDDCTDFEKSSLGEFFQNGKTYLLTVKPIEGSALIMVILSDITDSRESARRREEFFENASHELKTPLTSIKGFNELCMVHNKDEELAKYINAIARETERMLVLISDMMELSELENTQDINPSDVSLQTLADEIQAVLAPAITEKSLNFNISGDCTVSAEPRHVFDLMKNLMENAVRYNTSGGSVTVTLGKNSLKVSDTGIGIPADAQTRLFERFYRVEKSRSIQSGGTGLGLAIVKHICALYNWKLSLKSKPGVGTEVTVLF